MRPHMTRPLLLAACLFVVLGSSARAQTPPPQPAAPQRTVEELEAELARLRARESQTTVVNVVQQQQQQQGIDRGYRGRYARGYREFDINLLSSAEQERYGELLHSRQRRVAFPAVLTALSGAAFVSVFVAYAVLAGLTCEDYDTGELVDCSMPPGMLGFAALPALTGVIGGWMLAKRVPLKREFRALRNKGTRFHYEAIVSGRGVGLKLAF